MTDFFLENVVDTFNLQTRAQFNIAHNFAERVVLNCNLLERKAKSSEEQQQIKGRRNQENELPENDDTYCWLHCFFFRLDAKCELRQTLLKVDT